MANGNEAPGTAGLRPLILWCAEAGAAGAVPAALAGIRETELRDDLPAPDAAGGADILLLLRAPARALGRRLGAGADPEPALTDWKREAGAVLALNRHDRRRVQIADLDRARAHPRAFARHLGLPEGRAAPALPNPAAGDDPFLVLLAQRLLTGDAAARALMSELEAVTLPFGGGNAPDEPDDPGAVLRAWRETRAASEALKRDLERARAELALARDGAELVQMQNRAMHEELETLARRRQDLEAETARIPALRLRAGDRARGLAAAGGMVRDLEARNRHLQGDLAARAGQIDRLRARIAELETRIAGMLGSRSYRMTAPLRRIRGLFAGRGRP